MNTSSGSSVLIVLVFVAMVTVLFAGAIGVISRELHVTSDALQKERAYHIAEAGAQHALFLLNAAKDGSLLDNFLTQESGVYTVHDPATPSLVLGKSDLTRIPQAEDDTILINSRGTVTGNAFACSNVSFFMKGLADRKPQSYAWKTSPC